MRALVLALISSLSLSVAQASILQNKAQRYSEQVLYEVFRNSEPVGEYRLSFEPVGEQLRVGVEMQIEMKVFGLFNYDYLYQATEVWRADQIESLDVRMLTNGDEERIRAERQGEQLQVLDTKGRERLLPAKLLTTHHWLDDILLQQEVLNTLNGKVSKLSVKQEAQAVWMIDQQAVQVFGFRLGGDLDNTLSWYDNEGRWRGMSFKAKDDSTIDVRWQGAQISQS